MNKIVRDIYSGVAWNADFIAQTEREEIRIADKGGVNVDEPLIKFGEFLKGVVPEQAARSWAAKHARVFFDVEHRLKAIKAMILSWEIVFMDAWLPSNATFPRS